MAHRGQVNCANSSTRIMEERNIKRYYLRYVLYYFANTLITGGIIQSFMLESGIGSAQVSIYTAVIQFVQAFVMLLLGPFMEKYRNIIKLNAEAGLGLLPIFLAMLVICLGESLPVNIKYALMLASGVLGYIAYAVIGILEYKLPYRLIHMENYGVVLSITGTVIGVTSLVCSSLFSWFISHFDYFKVMTVFLIIGIGAELAAVKIGKSYEDLKTAEEERKGRLQGEKLQEGPQEQPQEVLQEGSQEELKEEPSVQGKQDKQNVQGTQKVHSLSRLSELFTIFSYGPFRKLFLPNLLRGIASGTFALLTTVGYYYSLIDASGAGIMTVIMNAVVIGGCLLYARLSKKKIDGPLTLISAVALLFLLPGMLLGQNTILFIVLYGVAALFKNFIDYTCPVICAGIVDYEHVSQFSSWRIALYMLGAALSGIITVPMLETFGGVPTMLFNGILFLLTGIGYFIAAKASTT